MIRFGVVLAVVVAALGLLVGGILTSSLLLVYLAIGVSALAAVLLVIGVVIWRDEIFSDAPAGSADRADRQEAGQLAVPAVADGTAGLAAAGPAAAPAAETASKTGTSKQHGTAKSASVGERRATAEAAVTAGSAGNGNMQPAAEPAGDAGPADGGKRLVTTEQADAGKRRGDTEPAGYRCAGASPSLPAGRPARRAGTRSAAGPGRAREKRPGQAGSSISSTGRSMAAGREPSFPWRPG